MTPTDTPSATPIPVTIKIPAQINQRQRDIAYHTSKITLKLSCVATLTCKILMSAYEY